MENNLRYSYALDCLVLTRGSQIYYFKDWDRLLRTMQHIASLDREAIAEADAKLILTEPPERIKFLLEQFKGEIKRPGKKQTIDFKLEVEP